MKEEKNKKSKKKLMIIFIIFMAIIVSVFFFWPVLKLYYHYPYLLINDTPNRVYGSVLGCTSPSNTIDIPAGKMQLIGVYYCKAELLKAYPLSKLMHPVLNLGLLKIVWISKLEDYPNE